METKYSDPHIRRSLLYATFIVAVVSSVFLVEWFMNRSFSEYGLLPRNITGLRGIFFMPFLHGDWGHLISNMTALFMLSALGIYTFKNLYWGALAFIWFATGTWTWLFARPDYHIGASGIVYGLATFCMLSGFLNKNRSLQGLTLLTIFLYGSFLWGIFPWEHTRDISWEGHLAGAIAGVIMALIFRREMPQAPTYNWENDPEENPENPEEAYWNFPNGIPPTPTENIPQNEETEEGSSR